MIIPAESQQKNIYSRLLLHSTGTEESTLNNLLTVVPTTVCSLQQNNTKLISIHTPLHGLAAPIGFGRGQDATSVRWDKFSTDL